VGATDKMNPIESRYENDLKPLKKRFFITALLFLIAAITFVTLQRNRRQLEKTFDNLTRAQVGLTRVKEANANRRQVLTALKSQFGHGTQNISPEMVLYGKIDEIKARLNPNDMTIATVEKKGGEASLQYTLAFSNQDFNNLLNAINYLHGSVFPLAPVNSVAITQSEAKGSGEASFKVTGKVITSEKIKP